ECRAYERMAKLDLRSMRAEQTCGYCGSEMLLTDVVRQQPRRGDDLADGAAVVQDGDEQQHVCSPRKLVGPRVERVLQTVGERKGPRRQSACSVVVTNRPWQLDQSQWVTGRRVEQARPGVEREVRRHIVEQRARVLRRQRIETELIEAQLIEAGRDPVTDG